MKPATNTLSELFYADVRYVVPLYQRPYVWKKETHWHPLWQDLDDFVRPEADPSLGAPSHFLGAIVLEIKTTHEPGPSRRGDLVIDGQQRLTTFQLLLGAAVRSAREAGAARPARLLHRLVPQRRAHGLRR